MVMKYNTIVVTRSCEWEGKMGRVFFLALFSFTCMDTLSGASS